VALFTRHDQLTVKRRKNFSKRLTGVGTAGIINLELSETLTIDSQQDYQLKDWQSARL
jgi:hypothetical protein